LVVRLETPKGNLQALKVSSSKNETNSVLFETRREREGPTHGGNRK